MVNLSQVVTKTSGVGFQTLFLLWATLALGSIGSGNDFPKHCSFSTFPISLWEGVAPFPLTSDRINGRNLSALDNEQTWKQRGGEGGSSRFLLPGCHNFLSYMSRLLGRGRFRRYMLRLWQSSKLSSRFAKSYQTNIFLLSRSWCGSPHQPSGSLPLVPTWRKIAHQPLKMTSVGPRTISSYILNGFSGPY